MEHLWSDVFRRAVHTGWWQCRCRYRRQGQHTTDNSWLHWLIGMKWAKKSTPFKLIPKDLHHAEKRIKYMHAISIITPGWESNAMTPELSILVISYPITPFPTRQFGQNSLRYPVLGITSLIESPSWTTTQTKFCVEASFETLKK